MRDESDRKASASHKSRFYGIPASVRGDGSRKAFVADKEKINDIPASTKSNENNTHFYISKLDGSLPLPENATHCETRA
jgi:hypothetical protein